MINFDNYHYIQRLAKRTIPFLKEDNKFTEVFKRERNDKANHSIAKLILSGKPFMVARFGSVEAEAITNHLEIKRNQSDFSAIYRHLNGNLNIFWKKHPRFLNRLCINAGFFPKDEKLLDKFVDMMLVSTKSLDILGIWNHQEEYIHNIPDTIQLCKIRELEPWFYDEPWSQYLEGKKVLIIHPFEADIQRQYHKNITGMALYRNPKILPKFDLKTIKAVQTIAGEKTEFDTWFDALHHMEKQIDEIDFDIAIIGCGAYGFPLASYIKNKGKQAIHLGGVTQLLFGIKGKRWEEWEHYTNLRADNGKHWIFPTEKPKNYQKIEGGCYW